MKTFPIDLMTLTNHIHTQYEKILSNKTFEDRMCECRKTIFELFTFTVEKLIIKLGARTLKFTEDYNLEISTNLDDLRKWFEYEIYDVLYEDDTVSNKMILTFQQIQEHQDKKFFKIIEAKYENILLNLKQNNEHKLNHELNSLFEEIRAWYELFIYMILATQFNCQSINDLYLTDNDVPPDFNCSFGEKGSEDKKYCIHNNNCNKCKVHNEVIKKGEHINIIMTNDFIQDTHWLDVLMNIVSRYHTSPEIITLSLDYRMYDQLIQCKLSHKHYDKILEANKVFKNIVIKNHEGINFNGYYEKLKHLID